jgi:hypothetical protein
MYSVTLTVTGAVGALESPQPVLGSANNAPKAAESTRKEARLLKFRLIIVGNGGVFLARMQGNCTLLDTVGYRLSASAVR